MPKLGMEPIRRAALVKATIEEIGAHGSLDVTVARIAKRAGIPKAKVESFFAALKAVAVDQLKEKRKFEIKGLATFKVRTKPARPAAEKFKFGKKVILKAKPPTKHIDVKTASGRAFYGLHVWGEWDEQQAAKSLRALAACESDLTDDGDGDDLDLTDDGDGDELDLTDDEETDSSLSSL